MRSCATKQSSRGLAGLANLAGLAIFANLAGALPAAPLAAQQIYRVREQQNFRREPDPGSPLLASVNQGVELRGQSRRGAWIEVTLEGWIWAQSVRADQREGYNLVAARAENLRREPNGPVLARVSQGTLLSEVERRTGWVRVRRTGWMYERSLETVSATPPVTRQREPSRTSAAQRPPSDTARPPTAPAAPTGTPSLDRVLLAAGAELRDVPEGKPVATVAQPVGGRVLARSGGWVRVQTEGWVREEDLTPSEAGVLVGVSAAELRSRPQEYEGKVVQWTVQFIAVQPPDEMRPELPEGRPWVLARGPQPEQGYVYVIATDEQLAQFRTLEPLATLVMLARVRTGRSRYLQVPVVELIEMRER